MIKSKNKRRYLWIKKKIILFSLLFILISSKLIYDYIPIEYEEKLDLKTYLGIEYNKLDEEKIKDLNFQIDTINNLNLNRKNLYLFDEKILELNKNIKNYGIALPYNNYEDYISDNKNKFSDADYIELQNINNEIKSLEKKVDSINSSKKVNKLYNYRDEISELEEKRGQILLKNNLDAYSTKTEIDNNMKNYITIPIENNKLLLEENIENKGNIILYEKIYSQVKDIFQAPYISYIDKLEIFTDGSLNTLAYVVNDDEKENKWILAVDLIDSLDYKGNFNKDFLDTLIHEFMHIVTLNDTQLYEDIKLFGETYTIDEGSLKENSYLAKFYNEYWNDYKDYLNKIERDNLSEEKREELIDNFYSLHKDEFVSDYAATNPVEDIAETFMYFVKEDKPSSLETIRDKKINFMYNEKELVSLRDNIRKNLNL